MFNDSDKISSCVYQINKRFERLCYLTNDELRNLITEIESNIFSSSNKKIALESALIDVFAIVKETARRFSNGDVIVTANRNDKSLAENYDFVTMDGDKAIYRNHWNVEGIPFIWNMIHYDEQLLGGVHLHYGKAIEMATGEGKTLVATLPIFLNALTHNGVHIMTVNDYLSKRDYQMTRPIYMLYGLSVGCIENYNRQEFGRKAAYDADITFGANSSFIFDYLFDHLTTNPKDCLQSAHNYAIIDEADSILIDEAETPHIVSGGMPYDDSKIYQEYFPFIKELVSVRSEILYTANKLTHEAAFTIKGKIWLSQKIHNNDLYKVNKAYDIEDFESLPIDKKKKIRQNIHAQNVLLQLLNALTVYEKDIDYVALNDRIKIIDQNTGRIKENSRWEHGLHTAIEVKENVTIRPDTNGMAVISLKNYFKLYNKISGMSGTVRPVRDELLEVYGLESAIIPSHLPVIRTDQSLRIYKSKESKDKAIISNVLLNSQNGRPTLLGTLSLKRADEIEKLLTENNLKFNRLDARTARDEAITVAKAGIGNTITLSTSVAGRGTDIKPSVDALSNGGLSVIGADLFGSVRTDLQLSGRAGRQGNPGSSIFYASIEDDIIGYLSDEERTELFAMASNIEGNDISIKSIRDYFILAQTKREVILRNRRVETARKDDTIAPYRAKFYEQRNRALFGSDYACSQIDDILSKIDKTFVEKSERNLSSLYNSTREIVRRSIINNPGRENIYIPYSVNQSPFVIKVDVKLVLTSKEYFEKEFKRQILLQVYDKFWKDFVVYVMQDLDQHEITMLPQRYAKMMDSISSIICSRLLDASPTFNVGPREENTLPSIPENKTPRHYSSCDYIKPNDLCPCGSGELYGKCHGRKLNQIRRRRRR